jgi:hypothetical protein
MPQPPYDAVVISRPRLFPLDCSPQLALAFLSTVARPLINMISAQIFPCARSFV